MKKMGKSKDLAEKIWGDKTVLDVFEKNLEAMKRMQWRVDCAISEIAKTRPDRHSELALSDLTNLKVEMSDIVGNRFYLC